MTDSKEAQNLCQFGNHENKRNINFDKSVNDNTQRLHYLLTKTAHSKIPRIFISFPLFSFPQFFAATKQTAGLNQTEKSTNPHTQTSKTQSIHRKENQQQKLQNHPELNIYCHCNPRKTNLKIQKGHSNKSITPFTSKEL